MSADDWVVSGDPEEQEALAEQLGREGEPAPGWVTADVGHHAAYKRGRAAREMPRRHAVPGVSVDDALRQRARRASRARAASDASVSAAGRGFSPAPVQQAARRVSAVGDAGGLLLVLVLYPLALATVRYGAAGPGAWFRAKWLNQPSSLPATGTARAAGAAESGHPGDAAVPIRPERKAS